MTEKFYYRNAYTKRLICSILDVRQTENDYWLLTDQTIFYPGGGGQLPDKGFIENQPVIDVKEKDGNIWHKVTIGKTKFQKGQKVTQELDWNYRFYQMQQHTGQHLLSAVLHSAGWPTVSVHLGENHTLVEVEGGLLQSAEIKEIEQSVREKIAQALPVFIHYVTLKDLKTLPLRRPAKDLDNLRVVEIKDFDYAACGGIHVQNCAEIGLIKIVGVEKIRGRARIKALIGDRAFNYLEELHQTNLMLREKLNTDHLQFNERVTQLQQELIYLKRLKKFYQPYFVKSKSQELVQKNQGLVIAFRLEQGEQEDAADLARTLSRDYQKVAFIQFDHRFFLASPSRQIFDTIQFLKEQASRLDLKGGGPQGFGQGIMKQNNLKQITETIKMLINKEHKES